MGGRHAESFETEEELSQKVESRAAGGRTTLWPEFIPQPRTCPMAQSMVQELRPAYMLKGVKK